MRNILFIWAIFAFLGSCTQDNVHMPETTTDTLRVVEHDTIKVTNENLSLFVGDNKVLVGGTYEYHSTILYQVLKNNDNTIDVIVPEYELKATIMGDLTIGKYTIRNIPYNTAKGSYYKEYADGTTERGKALRDCICKKFNFASLEFQTLEGVIKAIGIDPCELCTYCWDGKED